MKSVRLQMVVALAWLIAAGACCAPVPNPTITFQDVYLSQMHKDGHWRDIRAVKDLIGKDMPKALNYVNPELQEASLLAMQAKYLLTLEEKFNYLLQAKNRFDKIYELTAALNDKQKLYDFHVYRGLTFIGYPYYLVTTTVVPIKIAIADLETALELALPLQIPPEERARLSLFLSVEYVRDHQGRLAQNAAYDAILLTKDPTVYQLAYNITQTWTESLPPNYIDLDSW